MERSLLQEQLVSLYLRLNGYFVSGFIVHAPSDSKQTNRTQIDALAVRFPYNCEPERDINVSEFLQVPEALTDILICEVKGGNKQLQFNESLRTNDSSIRSVLRWIGAFSESDIDGLSSSLKQVMTPQMNGAQSTDFARIQCPRNYQIRPILFAPNRPKPRTRQLRYVCGNELTHYVWQCLRPPTPRPSCTERYDFGLWGPYQDLVGFFKKVPHEPSMSEIEKEFRATQDGKPVF